MAIVEIYIANFTLVTGHDFLMDTCIGGINNDDCPLCFSAESMNFLYLTKYTALKSCMTLNSELFTEAKFYWIARRLMVDLPQQMTKDLKKDNISEA